MLLVPIVCFGIVFLAPSVKLFKLKCALCYTVGGLYGRQQKTDNYNVFVRIPCTDSTSSTPNAILTLVEPPEYFWQSRQPSGLQLRGGRPLRIEATGR